jgi:hypothetical protein
MKIRHVFWKRQKKIDKPLARLMKKKEETPITRSTDEEGDVTTDTTEITGNI